MQLKDLKWSYIFRAAALLAPCEAIATSCTSACLLGVSLSKVFSIIFCVLLIIFAVVFGIIAWKSNEDRFMRIASAIGAVLMPIAGIGCIIVDVEFIKVQSPAYKSPLYMVIAAAVLINFAINTIQLINCCSWGNIKDRLLSNNKEVTWLLVTNVVLGLVLGLVFGLLDVEDESSASSLMTTVTIIFLFVGLLAGFGFAFFNEYQTQKLQNIGLDPLAAGQVIQHYDEM